MTERLYFGYKDGQVSVLPNLSTSSLYDVIIEQTGQTAFQILAYNTEENARAALDLVLFRPVHRTVVIYHGNCPDGLTGAAIANIALDDNTVEFVHGTYGDPKTDFVNSTIYFIDFSYKAPDMLKLLEAGNNIIVIDHHKTAIEELTSLENHPNLEKLYFSYDNSLSGAALAWNYFMEAGSQRPPLVEYVQDRDLWTWKHDETAAFLKYLDIHVEKTVEAYTEFLEADIKAFSEGDVEFYKTKIDEGNIMLVLEEHLEDSIIKQNTVFRNILGYENVPCINATGEFASKIGNKLIKAYPDAPFVLVWHSAERGIKVSIRSADDREDATKIAKKISPNGGGHHNASGALIPAEGLGQNAVALVLLGIFKGTVNK